MPSFGPSSQPSTQPYSGSADLLSNVQPSDFEFLDVVKKDKDEGVAVFKVKIGERLCIMKVFEGQYDELHESGPIGHFDIG
ncbi:hypothetical protein LMH87_011708 [Akanthomyces muscarius]|uniref:Uncharacterized protein n=1 Tax=Akanthomyces muscarius TaxID=2231603 RepID=A0A9W8QAB1_AKAMU|nr:hypothetical protein LMH87_011708 [Akanthomyces muscarius]KAJ4150986.1 hypothetical protein LMH87_011708 [Akanthomyces muscarius]